MTVDVDRLERRAEDAFWKMLEDERYGMAEVTHVLLIRERMRLERDTPDRDRKMRALLGRMKDTLDVMETNAPSFGKGGST